MSYTPKSCFEPRRRDLTGIGLLLLTLCCGCQPEFVAEPTEGSSFDLDPYVAAFQTPQDLPEGDTAATRPEATPPAREAPKQAAGEARAADAAPYPTYNARSGTRLRSRVIATYEGFESWVGWFDSDLGEDCAFENDFTGTPRCLPKHASRNVYYVDASCEQGVASVDSNQTAPHYAYEHRKGPCQEGVVIYETGNAVDVPGELYKRSRSGVCSRVSGEVVDSNFRRIIRRVDPNTFVAARHAVETNESRVKATGLVADDGTIEVKAFIDSDLSAQCSWTGDRELSCIPDATPISLFTNDTLSVPLLDTRDDSCAPSTMLGISYVEDSCGTYFRPGAPFSGLSAYELTSEALEQRSVDSDEASTLAMGEPVQVSEFARGKLKSVAVGTRLQPVHVKTTDGGLWFSHWHDTLLDTDCTFGEIGSKWMCLPTNTTDQMLWADAQCSKPVTPVAASNGCGVDPVSPEFVRLEQRDDRGAVVHLHRVGAPRPYLTVVYRKTSDGECLPEPPGATQTYFEVGEAISLDGLVSGSLVTR